MPSDLRHALGKACRCSHNQYKMIRSILVASLTLILPLSTGNAHAEGPTAALRFESRENEIRYYLAQYGLTPDWIRVMRVESGWQFDSYIAREGNNFFGMHAVRRRNTTSDGTVSFYASYPSIQAAIADLKLWSDVNPQQPNERFEHWLRRRRWNPNPGYYQYLRQVPAE